MDISKDEFKKIIGDTLRKARKKKNISQKDAAEKNGVSRSVLTRYENGTIDIPGSSIPELIYYYQSRMAAFDTAIQKYAESPNELKQALHKYAAPLPKQGETKTDKAVKPQLTEEEQSAVDNLMSLQLLIYTIASNYVAIQEDCQTQPALNHYIQKILTHKMLRYVYEGKEILDIEYKTYEF